MLEDENANKLKFVLNNNERCNYFDLANTLANFFKLNIGIDKEFLDRSNEQLEGFYVYFDAQMKPLLLK